MILIASKRVQIPLILDNYKRVKEDSHKSTNVFFDVSLRPPPPYREKSVPEIPEIDFFSESRILGSICCRLSEVREDGSILDYHPAKTYHT